MTSLLIDLEIVFEGFGGWQCSARKVCSLGCETTWSTVLASLELPETSRIYRHCLSLRICEKKMFFGVCVRFDSLWSGVRRDSTRVILGVVGRVL